MTNYKAISIQEAKERFSLYWIDSPDTEDSWWETEAAPIHLYEGDLQIKGDFKQAYPTGDGLNVIIAGDLIVEGHCERDSEGTNFMLVTGSLRAEALSISGGAYVTVKGDLDTRLLYGLNGEESRLWVAGDVKTEVIVSEYFMMSFDGAVEGLCFGEEGYIKAKAVQYLDLADMETTLLPEILDQSGEFDFIKASEKIKQGEKLKQ